ncbi:hypoxia inducible factor 1 subunit alpha, like 2 [Megalops cyprinoides]|uniref:hypoxia inducible factor 1 subunit alpha, like 2 n=1 Tax=Megalops cyprinoides TaxID=118141 RepID=UPI001863B06A|nr:hypoxia inducible factor 1 subunit alpha, like 2 [Megalops cyprinoides]
MSEVRKKRVCSEWRRARSRAAARSRREQETRLFGELAEGLPLSPGLSTHLDKASIIRLTLSYLRLRAVLDSPDCAAEMTRPFLPQRNAAVRGTEFGVLCEEDLLDLALEGFLLLLSRGGQVIYTTEAVGTHTGIRQMDLIGQSLYDFMHPRDQKEVREILSSRADVSERQECDLFFRMRCTFPPQGRHFGVKSTTWKVMHCRGVRMASVPAMSGCLVLLCQALPAPLPSVGDASLNQRAFLSRHTPDMRFTYCQARVSTLTGYTEMELLGRSVYQYYHALDCPQILKAHQNLLSKGQVSTGRYRLLVKHGGYVWVETVAMVTYNGQTGQPQSIVCVNYILSDTQQADLTFSLGQTGRLLKPCSSSPSTAPSLLLLGPALLDEVSQLATAPAPPSGGTSPGQSSQGYEGHAEVTVKEEVLSPLLEADERSEVTGTVSVMETLLEWGSEGLSQPMPQALSEQDLETLAPYIPMDGEDFLLTPFSDMAELEEVEMREQERLYDSLLLSNAELQGYEGPASPSPLLGHANTWPPRPGVAPQSQPGLTSCRTELQTLAVTASGQGGGAGLDREKWAGEEKWECRALKRWRRDTSPSPGEHLQCGCHPWSPQQMAPRWKKPKLETDETQCDPCWWSSGASGYSCGRSPLGSVPWAPRYAAVSMTPRTLPSLYNPVKTHPMKDSHRTVSVCSVLPVLSRWECEVNAPLGPTSCLLHGSEILSVLDQAASTLSPLGTMVHSMMEPLRPTPPLPPSQSSLTHPFEPLPPHKHYHTQPCTCLSLNSRTQCNQS